MTLPVRLMIKQRREALGLSQSEVASRIGQPDSMYMDVEYYDDEVRDVLPLKSVRLLATVLGLELGVLLGIGPLGMRDAALDRDRSHIISEARLRLGVSTTQMADDIGYFEEFVREIEGDDRVLEKHPYDTIRMVAEYLKIDPRELIGR